MSTVKNLPENSVMLVYLEISVLSIIFKTFSFGVIFNVKHFQALQRGLNKCLYFGVSSCVPLKKLGEHMCKGTFLKWVSSYKLLPFLWKMPLFQYLPRMYLWCLSKIFKKIFGKYFSETYFRKIFLKSFEFIS